jgi:hypothetical protein
MTGRSARKCHSGLPHLGLSIVLHELCRREEAKAALEKAITLDPRLAHANGNLEQVLQADIRLDVMVESRNASEPGMGSVSP